MLIIHFFSDFHLCFWSVLRMASKAMRMTAFLIGRNQRLQSLPMRSCRNRCRDEAKRNNTKRCKSCNKSCNICAYFRTCQVRVVRFYKSCPVVLLVLLLLLAVIFASFTLQWAVPDLNCELQITVGSAGPQRGAPDSSGQRRTSAARKKCQKIRQKECQKICQKECQKIC